MTFQSLAYFLFLAAAWLAARLARPVWLRQAALLAFSYAFYWSWSPAFLALLIGASLANFGWGRLLYRQPKALWLGCAVTSNVLLLFGFKYLPALLPAGASGLPAGFIAPVGISFYTFQAISYLVDVYRGYDDRPSLLEFALYLAFWPTILSGPICRLPEMLPQFRSGAVPQRRDIAMGLHRIILGLFLKVVLADSLALGLPGHTGLQQAMADFAGGAGDVWLLCLGFGFQIFFDFAGYSHVAIGSASLFGIRLRENFNSPFVATTISDFWNRWHMSLSSWIRDYLFFPLAASGRTPRWRLFALAFAMVVFGAWHGPRLTFALWGLYHGLLLAAHRIVQQRRRRRAAAADSRLAGGASWLLTLMGVTLGWILFASPDLGAARKMATALLDVSSPPTLDAALSATIITFSLLYFLVDGGRRALPMWVGEQRWALITWYARPAYLVTMLLLVVLWSDQSTPFVYVRF